MPFNCLFSGFAAGLVVASLAVAPASAEDRNDLSIRAAVSDAMQTRIFVDGTNFCAAPAVTLDAVPLTVISASKTLIAVAMPAITAPGTYRLVVTCRPARGDDDSRADSLDVAFGLKGAKGDKGDKGDPGATGAQGPAGAAGPAQGPQGRRWRRSTGSAVCRARRPAAARARRASSWIRPPTL